RYHTPTRTTTQPAPSLLSHTSPLLSLSFFFTDPAPTEIYTLSLHDALPILTTRERLDKTRRLFPFAFSRRDLQKCTQNFNQRVRSEEHTSELQSRVDLVCRLLLEKKK